VTQKRGPRILEVTFPKKKGGSHREPPHFVTKRGVSHPMAYWAGTHWASEQTSPCSQSLEIMHSGTTS